MSEVVSTLRSATHGLPESADLLRAVFDQKVLPAYDGLEPRTRDPIAESFRRLAYYCRLADLDGVARKGGSIVDLGPGLTPFGPLLSVLGGRVTLVDDFDGGGCVDRRDPSGARSVLERVRRAFGIEIAVQDLLTARLPCGDATIDAVTSFHCFEHFHHSPKHLMSEIRRVLRPGGVFVVGTPNAVNLRKRVSVLLGRSNHGQLEEWYQEGTPFRGHVREPVISDLVSLCEWNGLIVSRIAGANFLGHHSRGYGRVPGALRPFASALMDHVLPLWPSLCSDIHVVAFKPREGRDH